jgi:ABC-2 type transport system permease protein
MQKIINIQESYWYNPKLNYKNYMVPGILVILVTIIGTFLSGMNIVREKEIGTIEQLNVTPIGKFQFIIGKLIPFMIIGLFEFTFGLIIGVVFFKLPVEGSVFLIYGAVIVFLFTVLGIGLLISTMNDTQQQALLVSYFFMMLFVLMSGLFTPLESMPAWAVWLNKINPVAYFLKINRMIIMKGSGFTDIYKEALSLLVLGTVIFNLAVLKYRKTA